MHTRICSSRYIDRRSARGQDSALRHCCCSAQVDLQRLANGLVEQLEQLKRVVPQRLEHGLVEKLEQLEWLAPRVAQVAGTWSCCPDRCPRRRSLGVAGSRSWRRGRCPRRRSLCIAGTCSWDPGHCPQRRSTRYSSPKPAAARRCRSRRRTTRQMYRGAAFSLALMYLADSFAA
jgi:hypothetical protein